MACKLHLNIKAVKKLYPARGWGALTSLTTNTQQSVLLALLFLLTPPDAETSQGAVYSQRHLGTDRLPVRLPTGLRSSTCRAVPSSKAC